MKEGILNMKRGTWAEINLNNIKQNGISCEEIIDHSYDALKELLSR